jgi:hypothetical protein
VTKRQARPGAPVEIQHDPVPARPPDGSIRYRPPVAVCRTRCGEVKARMLAIHRDGEDLRSFVKRGFTAADLPCLLAGAAAECRSFRQPDPSWLR